MKCPVCERDFEGDPIYDAVGATPGKDSSTQYHALRKRFMGDKGITALGCEAIGYPHDTGFGAVAHDEWDVKQVIVIRRDLKMRRGKEIAQGSHASMYFIYEWVNDRLELSDKAREWLMGGRFTKAVCTVQTEEELRALDTKAKELGVMSYLMQDSGRTEFHGVPTYTALAIGPDTREKVDSITGELKLY